MIVGGGCPAGGRARWRSPRYHRGAEQMARHRLGRRPPGGGRGRQDLLMARSRLVVRRRRAVRVDVPCPQAGDEPSAARPPSPGSHRHLPDRGGHVIGVGRHPVPDDLGRCARRADARSRLSSTTIPAPAGTNPSRSASSCGLRVGSSLRGHAHLREPPMGSSSMIASEPPATMRSASPLDDPERVADRVVARGTGGHHGESVP